MFELYYCTMGVTLDKYMAIIDNPDKNLPGHNPFYDVTLCSDGTLWHGEQWTQEEHNQLYKRVGNGTSVFKKVKIEDQTPELQLALLKELEYVS